jgi:hypothetical protein
MISVYSCVTAVSLDFGNGASGVTKRKSRAISQFGSVGIIVKVFAACHWVRSAETVNQRRSLAAHRRRGIHGHPFNQVMTDDSSDQKDEPGSRYGGGFIHPSSFILSAPPPPYPFFA